MEGQSRPDIGQVRLVSPMEHVDTVTAVYREQLGADILMTLLTVSEETPAELAKKALDFADAFQIEATRRRMEDTKRRAEIEPLHRDVATLANALIKDAKLEHWMEANDALVRLHQYLNAKLSKQ